MQRQRVILVQRELLFFFDFSETTAREISRRVPERQTARLAIVHVAVLGLHVSLVARVPVVRLDVHVVPCKCKSVLQVGPASFEDV